MNSFTVPEGFSGCVNAINNTTILILNCFYGSYFFSYKTSTKSHQESIWLISLFTQKSLVFYKKENGNMVSSRSFLLTRLMKMSMQTGLTTFDVIGDMDFTKSSL